MNEKEHPIAAVKESLTAGGVPSSAPVEPKCKTCGGSGQVTHQVTNDGPDSRYEYIDCHKCDASGIEPASAPDALIERLRNTASRAPAYSLTSPIRSDSWRDDAVKELREAANALAAFEAMKKGTT